MIQKNSFLVLSGIFLLGIVIKIIYLGSDSYWFDEANTVGFTQMPFQLMIKHYYVERPVYFFILKLWVSVFGNGEVVTRLLSAILGSISVLVIYKFVKLFSETKVALFCAFILAVSFFYNIWSRSVMNYALYGFLAILCSFYFLKFVKLQQKADLHIYVLCTLLFIFTHPYALFLVFAQNLCFFLGMEKRFYREWIGWQLVVVIGILLLISIMFIHPPFRMIYSITRLNMESSMELKIEFQLQQLRKILESFTFGGRRMGHGGVGFPIPQWYLPLGYTLLLIYSWSFILGVKELWHKVRSRGAIKTSERMGALYLLSAFFVPLLAVIAITFWIPPVICERYFFMNYFSFIAIVAIGIFEGIKRMRLRLFIAFLIVILSLINIPNLYLSHKNETWRNISAFVRDHVQKDDAIVLIPFGQITSFWFYYKKDIKDPLSCITKDGIYVDGKAVQMFSDGRNQVLGSDFKKIDAFIAGAPFKRLSSEKKDIWLVMSPHWEEVDRAAEKVYRSIEQYFRRTYQKYYPFNGVSVEKWDVKD